MSENTRRLLSGKVHLYHALYLVNRGFDITLAGLKRLEELGIFRDDDLSEYEVTVELARCEVNEELTSVLQSYEEDDSVFWDDRLRERQKQRADPDDVFFKGQERKQEIKEKIKNLQAGLKRTQAKKSNRTRKQQAA
jgi:hypothetical protein